MDCKKVATQYHADFLNIENRGYGAGNNVGVKYAMEHYKFDYLVISNSDIIIEDFAAISEIQETKVLIAPSITILTGGKQNPNIVFESKLRYNLYKKGLLNGDKAAMFMARVITRASREIVLFWSRVFNIKQVKIFGAHGAFFIMSASAAKELYPIFNEDMFLYNEEYYLAYRCKQLNIPVYFCPKIKIKHLEGASSSAASVNVRNQTIKSFEILDKWVREEIYK